MKIFAERLKQMRESHGLTPAQVARELRVSTQMYLRWEHGLSKIGVEHLVRAACFYKVSADFLLGLI